MNEVNDSNNQLEKTTEQFDISNVEAPSVEKEIVQEKPETKPEPVYDEVPRYEEVNVVKEVRTDSYFDGKVLDLLGWQVLCYLITAVTATIAYPWGKCMVMSYKVGHTVLNGKRLKFEGTGGDLFVQRFKWIFFTIITLGIYGFWVPLKEKNWELSKIHFEDEPLVEGESFFDGKVLQLIGINWLCNFLNVISIGFFYPFTVCIKYRWLAKHAIINRKKIMFRGSGLKLLGKYILWNFLTIITFGIYGFWREVKMEKWLAKNSSIKKADEFYEKDRTIAIFATVFAILFVIAVIVVGNIVKNVTYSGEPELIERLQNAGDEAHKEAFAKSRNGSVRIDVENEVSDLIAFKGFTDYPVTGYYYYSSYDSKRPNTTYKDVYLEYEYGPYSCQYSYLDEKFECEYDNEYIESIREKFDNIGNIGRRRDQNNVAPY